MKTRIEFSTLEELYEEGAKYLFDSQYGFVGEMEEDIDEQMHDFQTKMETSREYVQEKKNYRVYAMLPTGTLYVCKNGTTFHARDAMLFTKEKAREKARYMTAHGKYAWSVA